MVEKTMVDWLLCTATQLRYKLLTDETLGGLVVNYQVNHQCLCCVYGTSYVASIMLCVYIATLQSTGYVHGQLVKVEVLSVQAEL